jgi:hypothetical protein
MPSSVFAQERAVETVLCAGGCNLAPPSARNDEADHSLEVSWLRRVPAIDAEQRPFRDSRQDGGHLR